MTGPHHHKEKDEKAKKDPKKEMKHHKHLQHLGQATTIAAGVYALVITLS